MIKINNFMIDAALSESHSHPSTVTSFPVEQGSDLTDHIREEPIEVEIEGIVSDTPIGATALARENETAEAGEELEFLPSEEALARLLRIRERRLPVTIQTSKRVYEDMAMESLDIPVDKTTGKVLRFTARFKQIRTVTNLRTTIRTATPIARAKKKFGPHPELEAARRAGGILVFTVGRTASGATIAPAFVKGTLSTHELVLRDDAKRRDYYKADKPYYTADGYVAKGRYRAFKEPIFLPNDGSVVVTDTTRKVWHQYTFNRQEVDAAQAANAADATDVSDLAGPDPDPQQRWQGIYGD